MVVYNYQLRIEASPNRKHEILEELVADFESRGWHQPLLLFHTFRSLIKAMEDKPQTQDFRGATFIGRNNFGEQIIGIDNSATVISQQGAQGKEVAEALRAIAVAIAASENLPTEKKQEAVDHVEFLAEQAAKPVGKRNVSIIRNVLGTLPTIVSSAKSLTDLWNQYGPVITAYFS